MESLPGLSDEQLVARFSETGKPAYFGELYARYAHLAFGVGLKYLKEEEDSRDLVSEVFKTLFKKLPQANVQSFRSYLYASTRNECMAILRQRKVKFEHHSYLRKQENYCDDFMENEEFLRLFDTGPSLETIVKEAIQQLSEDQRICIQLFFYGKKSYREIANMTRYSEKQVKSFLQNGKRNLRILLKDGVKKYSY